jgi:hypothetical protein
MAELDGLLEPPLVPGGYVGLDRPVRHLLDLGEGKIAQEDEELGDALLEGALLDGLVDDREDRPALLPLLDGPDIVKDEFDPIEIFM